MVQFEYIEEGITVGSRSFPMLKMEWIDAPTLDVFVRENLKDSAALALLADLFYALYLELQRAGIAHGDLQHGNIMVGKSGLRLVDYDAMYVPSMSGMKATESGHPDFQHPGRAEQFGPFLDNFSARVVYTSLQVAARDPSL